MVAAGALMLSLLAGASGEVNVGLRAEGRSRTTDPTEVQGATVLGQASLSPWAHLQVAGAGTTFTLGYDPRFSWTNLGGNAANPTQLDALHTGSLRLLVAPGPSYSLTLGATGAVGRTDMVTLRQVQPPTGPPQVIPTTSAFPYQNLRAELSLHLFPSRRSTWTLSGSAAQDGGSTAEARATLPTQNSATARLDYAWNATRLDAVGARLDATGSVLTATDNRSAFATALATWRRQLSPTVTASAGAGAVWLHAEPTPGGSGAQGSGAQPLDRFRPAGEATIAATAVPETAAGDPAAVGARPVLQPLRADASFHLGGGIDRLTGEVSQQLDGSAGLTWTPVERLSLSARASGAVSWQVAGLSRRAGLDLTSAWEAWPLVHLQLGAYATQQTPVLPAPAFVEYGISLGVSLDAPTLRWRSP